MSKGADDADSKDVAKDRLRLVLVHDRSMLPPETLDALRAELIEVVSRYFEVDHATLSMDVQRNQGILGSHGQPAVAAGALGILGHDCPDYGEAWRSAS